MSEPDWLFFRFGLIVTGKGEEDFLPSLFRTLQETGKCSFQVIRRIGQRTPITSTKKKLRMTGSGKVIPDRDQSEIGIPARRFLSQPATYVVLVDDLEIDRSPFVAQVFERYRIALDTILLASKNRASVHFFVNMLEAYYFADAKAINAVLKTELQDFDGDVETIPHPKSELKKLTSDFDEIEHGRQIVKQLDVPHVLSIPETCASLRTLFAWCVAAIRVEPGQKYQLVDGRYSQITKPQIENLNAESEPNGHEK